MDIPSSQSTPAGSVKNLEFSQSVPYLDETDGQTALYIGASIEMRISDSNRVMLSKTMKDCFGNPLAHLIFNYTEEDLRTLDRSRDLIREIYRKLGATDVREVEASWSRHHQSTCRMGDNPRMSVVNRNLRIHESPNLYLCGSEVFVTGGAMQPCLSIAALAHRLADHLVSRLKDESEANSIRLSAHG